MPPCGRTPLTRDRAGRHRRNGLACSAHLVSEARPGPQLQDERTPSSSKAPSPERRSKPATLRLAGFADSDTRPAPTLLAERARAVVTHPDVGAAFAPAVSVSRPRTVGDVGYGLLLDGITSPSTMISAR
jgi:hypothetical protein